MMRRCSMFMAANMGDLAEVEALLAKGADVKAVVDKNTKRRKGQDRRRAASHTAPM